MSDNNVIKLDIKKKSRNEAKDYSIYIAGPMTGIEHFNFPAFDKARDMLAGLGYSLIYSPPDIDRAFLEKAVDWVPEKDDDALQDISYRVVFGNSCKWLIDSADGVYMLRGWEESRGARAEHCIACALGLEITYE